MQKIIILMAASIVCLAAFKQPNQINISGKVTNEKGDALPGVAVKVIGTTDATVSDQTGLYRITVKDEKSVLLFSTVGYAEKKIKAGRQTTINVKLSVTSQHLDDVVVIGYGTRKQDFAESAQDELQSYPQNSYAPPSTKNATPLYDFEKKQNQTTDKTFNREGYDFIKENSFVKTRDNALSTFSIDVDAASYSNVRRMLEAGTLPPAGAVRIEEMINYFKYDYEQPKNDLPFVVATEIGNCPWNNNHKLALIGLQGKVIPTENLPASNLVFLIDVSGSMMGPQKLPLVQQSMVLLTNQLREQDNVAIVVYAGNAGLVLPSTSGANKAVIKNAIGALQAGGPTAGGEGIKLAYKTALANFKKEGNNRIILCTDGDFNVGTSSDDELETLIENERKSGVFLTILGYGMGNYQDAKMQKLADKGNGNHAYIDKLEEAKKVLVQEFGGTLFTIAKDVKLQVEFNPALVQGYRLIGYENRMLAKEDFNDDTKDAGELGSGHTVTALYEIIPAGKPSDFLNHVDSLKYQQQDGFKKAVFTDEWMTVKLRYKQPDGSISHLMELPVLFDAKADAYRTNNYRFAAAVASFGLLLRNSDFKQNASYNMVIDLAKSALGKDAGGYRKAFVQLVKKAASLNGKEDGGDDDEDVLSSK